MIAEAPSIPEYDHQCIVCQHTWTKVTFIPDVFCPQCNSHMISYAERPRIRKEY